MPNLFAYIVLLSWPLVTVVLFRVLSTERAIVWTILGGHLLLPSETSIKIPTIPVIDRTTVTAMSAVVLCALMARKTTLAPAPFAAPGRSCS
jgi:hypothetical protein